jgi:hypothetical protein
MFQGADPSRGWTMTDPIFGKVPTLGACMPNIRRVVDVGDHIFVISGRVPGAQQYIVGGFQVAEKIDALAAYRRFPENRMRADQHGSLVGNIITDANGKQVSVDYHANFAERVKNYVVGRRPKTVIGDKAVERAREGTVPLLSELFDKKGASVHEVIGRWRKLDEAQIKELRGWIDAMNGR